MQKIVYTIFIMVNGLFGFGQYFSTEKYPVYQGNDLGLTYSKDFSTFKIWSPPAEKALLLLYDVSTGGQPTATIELNKGPQGTWNKTISKNLKGKYYAFKIYTHGKWMNEVPDPYAKAVGTNGKRAVVVDLKDTDPRDWHQDISPKFSNRKNLPLNTGGLPNDAIIYEMHVRDFTIDKQSGVQARGKYKGLTEVATMNIAGVQTGLEHLHELGVTHVHLLPVYDFYSIDESKKDSDQYNWGYDPLNYNTPEGSYATNADDGVTRIREFKEMVRALHQKNLRVVMDVVYNHTMLTENSYFNQLVPGYYYRQKEDGAFSNASACGNETASERPMMRKFMIESLKYWVKEYHIDGFRFDLMGIHDIETMNRISHELRAIKPDILLYGEGWTAGASPLPDSLRALKKNAYQLSNIAVFSDDLRDAIKGSVFEKLDKGFASGKSGLEESIKFGITAGCMHPQVDYSKVNYSKAPYAKSPSQVISYVDCHDNNTLWDKLAISNSNDTAVLRRDMHKLALTIVLTSQGISFLHAGTEFLRSKKGVENSFNSSDDINRINWFDKADNSDVYQYVRSLVSMRKSHPAFRLSTQKEIASLIHFEESEPGIIAYQINGAAVGDEWKKIFIVLNGNNSVEKVKIPDGSWEIFAANNIVAGKQSMLDGEIRVNPYSACILYKK